ncbi:MAG: ATP-binding protein [bacterium]|nr:ATP-binding protein [bacterium]
MITKIEALHYRCLKYISQELRPFQVLIGPNASGKTTFLDVVGFIGSFVSSGVDSAVNERTNNLRDLVWGRERSSFELAIEVSIPAEKAALLNNKYETARYEVGIGDGIDGDIRIQHETLLLVSRPSKRPLEQRDLFPQDTLPPETLFTKNRRGEVIKTVISKTTDGNDNFYAETRGWKPVFKFGPKKSALANLPSDESKFPISVWFREYMTAGIRQIMLNSMLLRKASPPGHRMSYEPDGANLPWIVERLKNNPQLYSDWIRHLQTALSDLEEIRTIERPDDKHRYLMLRYRNGIDVPSWTTSDGTLRLLALTILAYLNDFAGSYLIEEPENGIHPKAVETLCHSLKSLYQGQILVASHSPIIISTVDPKMVLCFAKTSDGATDIVSGDLHPELKKWNGETNLGILFAGGILG